MLLIVFVTAVFPITIAIAIDITAVAAKAAIAVEK